MNRNKSVQRLSAFLMILTLTILACQGASNFNPFATATPTASQTPTFTPSPTPTHTPTVTPTPRPTGKLKEKLPDGATLFTDYDGRYQLTFPAGWTVAILDQDEIEEILDRMPEQDQNISSMLESIQTADLNHLIRVVGFHFKAQQGKYTPNINVSYDTNHLLAAISLEDLIANTTAYFPSLNITVINSEVKKTSARIEIGVIEAQWSMKGTNNQKVTLHQKQIFFKSGDGVVGITFSTLKGVKVDLNADLEKLIESIQLLD